jgi:hypothetical protein
MMFTILVSARPYTVVVDQAEDESQIWRPPGLEPEVFKYFGANETGVWYIGCFVDLS